MLSLIVAMSNNHVIGNDNMLPWHLPNDLQYFKQVTMGKPIIMGRKTFESIGRPLPGRRNIIISRQADYQPNNVDVVDSIEKAIELASNIALVDGHEEVMVIGGAQIYEQALPFADRLYITHVDAEINGDAFFPEFNTDLYRISQKASYQSTQDNPYNYRFDVYDRIEK